MCLILWRCSVFSFMIAVSSLLHPVPLSGHGQCSHSAPPNASYSDGPAARQCTALHPQCLLFCQSWVQHKLPTTSDFWCALHSHFEECGPRIAVRELCKALISRCGVIYLLDSILFILKKSCKRACFFVIVLVSIHEKSKNQHRRLTCNLSHLISTESNWHYPVRLLFSL